MWRIHHLPEILSDCWNHGVVLAGASAGSICWHTGGVTDSYRDSLDPFTDGLGLLPYSNGVHDDYSGQPRRRAYRQFVADHSLQAGYATEDGVGLHYIGTKLHEAVTIRSGSHAHWVEPAPDGGHTEITLPTRFV